MASDGESVVTEVGSLTNGQAIQDYDAFTAHEKDIRKRPVG